MVPHPPTHEANVLSSNSFSLSPTSTYLIQLKTDASISTFKDLYPNVQVGSYVPHASWIVSASDEAVKQLVQSQEQARSDSKAHSSAFPLITFITPLHHEHKSRHEDEVAVIMKEHGEDQYLTLSVHAPHCDSMMQLHEKVRREIIEGVLKNVIQNGALALDHESDPNVSYHQQVDENGSTMPVVWKVRAVSDKRFIVVVTSPQYVMPIMRMLKKSSLVHWVEVKAYHANTLLKDATGLVQNFEKPTENALWKRGLTGKGQLIGVGDTGIDVKHCMFYDPENEVPFFQWNGSNTPPKSNHRKIAAYWSYMDGVDSEGLFGHGTHVSGIASGSPLAADTPDSMKMYKSLAFDSKLVFMDIGCDDGDSCKCPEAFQCECDLRRGGKCKQESGVVYLPIDLGYSYFPYFYSQGVRVTSNSWGTGYFKDFSYGYSTNTMEIDDFVWRHRDFLPFFAAGNSGGSFSYISLTSEAESKNGIAIGASQNLPTSDANLYLHDYNQVVDAIRKVLINKHCDHDPTGKQCRESKKLMDSDDCCKQDLHQEDAHKCGNQAFGFQIGFKCCPRCIRMAAATQNSRAYNSNNLGEFSARGPATDGRIKPDIVTVGAPLMSAVSKGPDSFRRVCHKSLEFGQELASRMGTSMACPLAASEGVLVRQFFADGYYPSGAPRAEDAFAPSAALMKATLIHSTRVMTGYVHLPSRSTYWPLLYKPGHRIKLQQEAFQGFGLVDLVRVLGSENGKNEVGLFVPNKKDAELMTNEVHEYCVSVKRDTSGFSHVSESDMVSLAPGFRATLVWTDYPSSPAAQQHLVNDLDLIVLDETGKAYYGNGEKSHIKASVHGADKKNNVEDVVMNQHDLEVIANAVAKAVSKPVSDTVLFNVVIRGSFVPQGPQPYALVMTGVQSALNLVKCERYRSQKLINTSLTQKLKSQRSNLRKEYDLLKGACESQQCSKDLKNALKLAEKAIMNIEEDIASSEGKHF